MADDVQDPGILLTYRPTTNLQGNVVKLVNTSLKHHACASSATLRFEYFRCSSVESCITLVRQQTCDSRSSSLEQAMPTPPGRFIMVDFLQRQSGRSLTNRSQLAPSTSTKSNCEGCEVDWVCAIGIQRAILWWSNERRLCETKEIRLRRTWSDV